MIILGVGKLPSLLDLIVFGECGRVGCWDTGPVSYDSVTVQTFL